MLPGKLRASISLPPTRRAKTAETAKARKSKKEEEPFVVPGCYGDFCNAEFKYPHSLKDSDSSQDPWMRVGRALCERRLGNQQLLEPDELVACFEEPPAVPLRAAKAALSAGLVLEARLHPRLCAWLQERGWRWDPEDVEAVTAAAAKLREDSQDLLEHMARSASGLRYRLRTLTVCRTCLATYQIIHDVIFQIQRQRRDLWANRATRELRRRKEEEKERTKQAEIERMLAYKVSEILRYVPDSPSEFREFLGNMELLHKGTTQVASKEKVPAGGTGRRKGLVGSVGIGLP
ncbi:unnamed protein product [Effrenium voratum]|nr:unnamed protein product [Effrenium voratum]